MNINFKFVRSHFLVALMLLLNIASKACGGDEKYSQLKVLTNVAPFCSINSTSLAFKNYKASEVVGSASIMVICSESTKYYISLDYGRNGNENLRKLRYNNNLLNYQLYQNEKMNIVWGNSQNNSLSGVGTGQNQMFKVYGVIPANQLANAGLYNDIIYININMLDANDNSNLAAYQMTIRMNISAEKI